MTPRRLMRARKRYATAQHAKDALTRLVATGKANWHKDKKTVSIVQRPYQGRPATAGEAQGVKKGTAGAGAGGTGGNSGPLQGLSDLPPHWGDIPPNASLQAEIAWVQAHRIDVIETTPRGAVVIHLDRAATPAPSKGALSWLEASIRTYAKYTDVVSRAMKDVQDEQDIERRERLAIEEIEVMLAEMLEDGDV